MKICNKCGIEKPVGAFPNNKRVKSGKSGICRECNKARCRKYYRENPAIIEKYKARKKLPEAELKMRDRFLQKTYGISLATYNQMLKDQNYCCAMCGRHESGFSKSLSVDHNHMTGKVRALLCFSCNKMKLGKHTIESLKEVMEYLLKYDLEKKDAS